MQHAISPSVRESERMTLRMLEDLSGIAAERLPEWAGYHALQSAAEASVISEGGEGIGLTLVSSGSGVRLTRAVFRSGDVTQVEAITCKGLESVAAAVHDPQFDLRGLSVDDYVIAMADAPPSSAGGGVLMRSAERLQWESASSEAPAGILSGSFFPLHGGHRAMKAAAEEVLQCSVGYEMTLLNADKPPLDYLSLERRAGQFTGEGVLLTSAATFAEKAECFPGATFAVGWDTARRILDRRFYRGGELESALADITERECRFLVAARREGGRVRTLSDLAVPAEFAALFVELPESLFLEDVSSTEIRDAWWRGEGRSAVPSLFV